MEFINVLKRPAVFKLWLSQIVSAIGDRFFDVAVVWIATEQVGAEAGFVVVAGTVASLVFGLFGGIYADRWNRRITMISADLIRAAVLGVLVAITALGTLHLWHLAVVMAILSALNGLFEPALYASLPVIVTDARGLQATNALFDVTWRVSTAVSPALAGYALAVLPVETLFFADGVTFVLSALALFAMGSRYAWKAERSEAQAQQPIWEDLQDGLRAVWNHRPLTWGLVIMILLGNLVWSLVFLIGAPLFVRDVLGGSEIAFGWILASYGVGNVLSNLVIGNLSVRRRVMMMFSGTIVLGGGFILVALAPSLPLAMLGAFIAAMGGPMEDIMLLLIMQNDLPSGTIGKVYSLRMVVGDIGAAIGLSVAALVFNVFSVPIGIILFASLQIIGGIVALIRFGVKPPAKPVQSRV